MKKSKIKLFEEFNNKKKVFVFAFDHSLPTAMAMAENGKILCQHAGDSYGDAIDWLLHHHQTTTLKNYDVVIMDKKKIKEHIYGNAKVDTLGEDFAKAFRNNQQTKGEGIKESLNVFLNESYLDLAEKASNYQKLLSLGYEDTTSDRQIKNGNIQLENNDIIYSVYSNGYVRSQSKAGGQFSSNRNGFGTLSVMAKLDPPTSTEDWNVMFSKIIKQIDRKAKRLNK